MWWVHGVKGVERGVYGRVGSINTGEEKGDAASIESALMQLWKV